MLRYLFSLILNKMALLTEPGVKLTQLGRMCNIDILGGEYRPS